MSNRTIVSASLILLAIFLGACSGSEPRPSGSPKPVETPPVETGGVTLAQNGYQWVLPTNPWTAAAGPPVGGVAPLDITFTFANSSEKELTIGSIEVVNRVGSAYSLTRGCDGMVLRPRQANDCVVNVLFAPPGPGAYSGELRLHLTAGDAVVIQRLEQRAGDDPSPPARFPDVHPS